MARLPLRKSMYSRAFLFTLIGGGCLLGAIAVQSWFMMNATVDRLLQERISLARTMGSYIEQLFTHETQRLADAVIPQFADSSKPDLRGRIREALAPIYPSTVFREGTFVLDPGMKVIGGVPDEDFAFVEKAVDLRILAGEARNLNHPIVSPLIPLSTGERSILLIVTVLRSKEGELLGYLASLLHPASNNLLEPFRDPNSGTRSTLEVLDRGGTVVATTRPFDLFTTTDHGNLIASSIRGKKEIRGRCHACHVQRDRTVPVSREREVMAFSPLPNLSLGVAVRQPEMEALAPAFDLRSRLWLLGTGFVFLFLLFTALAVHSVVSPLRVLSGAVEKMEISGLKTQLPSFGGDEVGLLSRAIDGLRMRVLDAVAELEGKEAALQKEFAQTRQHLAVLSRIAALGTGSPGVQPLLEESLRELLQFLGARRGVIRLRHGGVTTVAREGFSDDAEALAAIPGEETTGRDGAQDSSAGQVQIATVPGGRVFRLNPSGEISLEGAVDRAAGSENSEDPTGRRLESILHQIMISAANRMLRQEENRRHQQSREFLQKVLRAQEEERKRIARDLHDTLAQELAAHRLSIDRAITRTEAEREKASIPSWVPESLRVIEHKAHEMLVGLRQLLLDLRPSVLDTMGFLPAIQWYLERLEKDHGIHGEFSVEGGTFRLPADREMSLFRIFQEAMNNVIRHSKAEHWFVTLTVAENRLELVMEDDGVGFDETAETKDGADGLDREGGLGVRGMRERAELMGGSMSVQSRPGEGTVIEVRIPT